MDTQTPEEPGIGHNIRFQFRSEAELDAYLKEEYAPLLERTEALREKGESFLTIGSDGVDSEATEFLVKLRAAWKWGDTSRDGEKRPYDDRAGQVQAFFKTLVLDPLGLPPPDRRPFDPLARTDLGLGPRITMAQTIFKQAKAERERKAREEEARIAREAEAERQRIADAAAAAARELERAAARARSAERVAELEAQAAAANAVAATEAAAANKAAEERAAAESAAAAPLADLSRSRGGRGGVASLREFTEFRDINRDTLDYAVLGPYFKDAAIEQAIRGYIDANKATVASHIKNGTQPIRGVILYVGSKSAGRA